MAGRGPRPSPNARRTNNKNSEISLTTGGDRKASAPKLFKRAQYSVAVQRWWDTWMESPQAEHFLPTDIERLQQLAPLVQQYWDEPKTSILAEIRLNEERLGATIRDRQSLRMSITEPETDAEDSVDEDPEVVVDLDLYRELGGE